MLLQVGSRAGPPISVSPRTRGSGYPLRSVGEFKGVSGPVVAQQSNQSSPATPIPTISPATKAANAGHLADKIDGLFGAVTGKTALIATASATGDHAGWLRARANADGDLAELESLLPAAKVAEGDASASDKLRLGETPHLVQVATTMLQNAAPAPGKPAPVLASEALLLAALPPDAPVSDAATRFAVAENAVADIFRNKLVFSDIVAFQAMLRDHPEHTLVRRFHRFAGVRQTKLLAILDDVRVRGRARALEEAQRKAAAASPRPVVPPKDGHEGDGTPAHVQPVELADHGVAPAHVVGKPEHETAPPRHVELRVDKTKEGQRLQALIHRDALAPDHQLEIVTILEANASPEDMYALQLAYGGGLVADVKRAVVKPSLRARAFAYLGEQMPVEARIDEHDKKDSALILQELERLDDPQALAMVEGGGSADTFKGGHLHWVPANTTLAELKTALRSKLTDDDYYHAMRELLAKADRAASARGATQATVVGKPVNPHALDGVVLVSNNLSPAEQLRVELAEERIRGADAAGDWAANGMLEGPAYLALADLKSVERRELVPRLEAKPLKNLGGMGVVQLAKQADDATVIETALREAHGRAELLHKPANAEGTNVALGRGGELVQQARARVDNLPKTAPTSERDAATAELARLEKLFLADNSQLRQSLRYEQTRGGDPDADQLGERLGVLGADPVTIAAEKLRHVSVTDKGEELGRVLRRIEQQDRIPALDRAGLLNDRKVWEGLPQAQRDYIQALVWESSGKIAPVFAAGGPGTNGPQIQINVPPGQPGQPGTPTTAPPPMPMEVQYPTMGLDPEFEIAIHDVIRLLVGKEADRAFSMLARMPPERSKAVMNDTRYKAAFTNLPDSVDKTHLSAASDFGAQHELAKSTDLATARDNPKTSLEALGQRTQYAGGQAALRRAYVMIDRAGGFEAVSKNPKLLDKLSLTIDERVACDHLINVTDKDSKGTKNPSMADTRDSMKDDADRESANQIMFGQPQLVDSPDSIVDPNVEAEFMFGRLREAAGVRSGPEMMDHFTDAGPAMDAAVAEFVMLYRRLQPGGFEKKDLPLLAERYHRALRSLDAYRVANESFAATAAEVVGAVVATVAIMAMSGGTLGPVAMGAVAGLSAGAAQAATGAALRLQNTAGSVLRDFGTGAVQGAVGALASPLAARVVRGASVGVSAGRAAAMAGEAALTKATGGLGSHVAMAAIEGAFGNGAAELFATATDEATWDRGIAEALATMLSAVARGALIGAAAGGATVVGVTAAIGVGKLIGHVPEAVARLAERAGVGAQALEKLSENEANQLKHVYDLIHNGELDKAEQTLSHIQGLESTTRQMMMESERARVAVETVADLGPVDFNGLKLQPREVTDKEFARLAGGRGDAALIIENGEPQIVIRRGASASAIREEVTHLHQWQTDPIMRERMAKLSEEKFKPGVWEKVSVKEKLDLHITKLEVESDGQQKILDRLVGTDGDQLSVADAQENLFLINERLETLRVARQTNHIDAGALKLDEPPRLFTKSAATPKNPKKTADWDRALSYTKGKGAEVEKVKDELGTLGYRVHRRGSDGPIFKITRNPDKMNSLPHLGVDEASGTITKGVGSGFDERAAAAGDAWSRDQVALPELHAKINAGVLGSEEQNAVERVHRSGPEFRLALAARFPTDKVAGRNAAGMLARWGECLELLQAKCRLSKMPFQLAEFVDHLPTPLTEAAYDKFRRDIRGRTMEMLKTITGDDARRQSVLEEMLAVQPESGSKGELFTSYREWDMEQRAGFAQAADKPPAFTGGDLENTRTPDGRADVSAPRGRANVVPSGNYAIEDKSGPGAFKIKQAQDYGKRATKDGFRLSERGTKIEYDNVMYVFSNRDDALAARAQMSRDSALKDLIDKDPGGIHVTYYDRGQLLNLKDVR